MSKIDSKGGERMSFDWGGFTGGIIGTFGAFGAAWYTIWRQKKNEEPLTDERSREIITAIRTMCDEYWLKVVVEKFKNTNDVYKKTSEINTNLRLHLSAAIGTDKSLVMLILQITGEISNAVQIYTENKEADNSLEEVEKRILRVLNANARKCDLLEAKLLNKYAKPKLWWLRVLFNSKQ